MDTINKIEIKGRIGSIRKNASGNGGVFFINSFINKRDVSIRFLFNGNFPEDIVDGDTVIVKGFITVRPPAYRAPQEHYKQVFRATEIEKSPSIMEEEFGEEGTFQSPDYFRAVFKGVITGIKDDPSGQWKKLTLLVDMDKDRTPSRIAMDYQLNKNRFLSLPDFTFKNGDAVKIIASVTTSAKKINGEEVHFQNLKIVDIKYTR